MWKLAFATSFVAAIGMSLMLKLMQLFEWIGWHPTAFIEVGARWERWVLLGGLLFAVALLLYIVLQYSYRLPRFIGGFIVGLLLALVVEWRVLHLPLAWASVRELSVPFIVTVVMLMLFIVETATFHRERFVSRNNLPYKKSMVK